MRITNHLAVLRNLRNVVDAHVSPIHLSKLKCALVSDEWTRGSGRILPFRYVAAARAVPSFEPELDIAMQNSLQSMERLPGKTAVLVDVSPSMNVHLSAKSDLTRTDAAGALAVLLRGVCTEARVFAFSTQVGEAPPRTGMALLDAIKRAAPSNGTMLGNAVRAVAQAMPNADRLIVFTDEESQDSVGPPHCKGYMVNVATSKNGVGYGDWTHINGFSESVVSYIAACETRTEQAP